VANFCILPKTLNITAQCFADIGTFTVQQMTRSSMLFGDVERLQFDQQGYERNKHVVFFWDKDVTHSASGRGDETAEPAAGMFEDFIETTLLMMPHDLTSKFRG